ncbi:MAG TPA: hypothetical protein PK471_03695 [Bacteroidales bacterium]|nr:hypothetical protein [Bacteroidales bacterium]
MKAKVINVIKIILRWLMGITFIVSAILKLISVDHFDLYIYSFGIFNFTWVSFLSRVLIAFELLLGLLLISRLYYRKVWYLTLLTMVGFTLFLIYTAIFRNDSNCHCFGTFVEFNPIESIIKNLILIALLFVIYKQNELIIKRKGLITGIVSVVAFTAIFIISPPDSLFNALYHPKERINSEALDQVLQDSSLVEISDFEGNQIVAIFIPGCKYCQLSMQRLASIFERHQLDPNLLKIVIVGNPEGVEFFRKETNIDAYPILYYPDPISMFKATSGSFPTLLFMENKSVKKSINFRGIDEKSILDHLQ